MNLLFKSKLFYHFGYVIIALSEFCYAQGSFLLLVNSNIPNKQLSFRDDKTCQYLKAHLYHSFKPLIKIYQVRHKEVYIPNRQQHAFMSTELIQSDDETHTHTAVPPPMLVWINILAKYQNNLCAVFKDVGLDDRTLTTDFFSVGTHKVCLKDTI